ncbi:MAG: hypothetical protein WAW37_05400 [Syntrophobacteraceae bacterium]
METGDIILDTIQLDNGLIVYFIDRSRPIAGDRWQVRLLIRVPLEPGETFFARYPDPPSACADFASLCPTAEFEVEKVRNFIDAGQREAVLEQLKKDFVQSALGYLANPGFAEGWITRKYEELRRERATRDAYEQALR